ncbi:retrovirus-related pol polyprotein from transposon TNT 1-94 [Tanacetum coccineum]
MHVEKNVAESIVGTLLHVPGKIKDGLNARLDLPELGVKPELFAMQDEDKTTLPLIGYTLTNAEKDIFCETLHNIKVLEGYCSNFSSLVNLKDRKPIGLKSHDYHMLIGCIAEETIAKETIEYFSEYHKSIETIGILPDKHETDENEEGKPLSVGKSSEVSAELFQKAHLYVIQNTDEIVPYIENNGDALRKCILEGHNTPSTVIILAVLATENYPLILEQTTIDTVMNMSPKNKDHIESEKEAIHLILTGIGDEIYSTVDVCKTAHEMWEAIERSLLSNIKVSQIICTNIKNITSNQIKSNYKTQRQEIAKPITPPSESASEEDSDPEQAHKDKEMQKFLALIAKYFKKLYKPTNNNLRTSSNTRNKNVDTNLRYKNDNQTRQFGNQRTMTVAGARETIGNPVVKQSRIQCFNYKEFRHFAKECRKPKRVKNSMYHKEKILLCKQAEKGVPL